jgi:hypothetical protein
LLFVLQQVDPQLLRKVDAVITTKTSIIFFIIRPCLVIYFKYTS